jgi:cyclopropane-fatty-acyl-phospholipid synthase
MWETLLDRMLAHLFHEGRIEVTLPGGRVLAHGPGDDPVRVTLHDPTLPRRIALNPDLAVGEGYMDGTLTIAGDELHRFLTLAIRNIHASGAVWFQRPLEGARKALRRAAQFNPAPRAQKNVAHHYDLSGALYRLFLDEDRQYSCAYFRTPDDTLEQAQLQKKRHIAGKLLLKPGMRVLDIGCGWGGMALTLAREYGARVTGVTLSREQLAVATERARAEGLSDRVEFRLQDYRAVRETFDRIVSVGMFEHVGVPHYRQYFRHVRRMLTDDGVALIHTIGRPTPPGRTGPWIEKYIFPGGYVPAMSEALAAIEKEGLTSTDIEVWRLHYAMTLHHWYDRFTAHLDAARAIYDERFCRMWRYYLAACEVAFREGGQMVFQFQLARDQAAVPLTRDYLYAPPQAVAVQRPRAVPAE